MPLSESKIRSRKPLLTSHHSDSIIMVLQTKTVKRSTKAVRLAIASVSFNRKFNPKVLVPGDVTLFYNVRDGHENVPPPPPPHPPMVIYEVSG